MHWLSVASTDQWRIDQVNGVFSSGFWRNPVQFVMGKSEKFFGTDRWDNYFFSCYYTVLTWVCGCSTTDQLCLELCAQPFDHEQIPVSVSQQAKSLDLPESIATLCNAIADTSRQSRKENTFFESILLHVLTPEKKSVKRSPVKQLSATPVSIEDHLDLLERRLQQSRSENKQFESYLKRALNDA